MKSFGLFGIVFTILCALTVSCKQRSSYFEYHPTPTDGWETGDTLRFHIDTLLQSGEYSLTLGLRTSAAQPYPFKSLWLVVRQHWHTPELLQTDTVECKLTDRKGDVIGQGVSLYQYSIPLESKYLTKGASADIGITHIMSCDILTGIKDVGMKLTAGTEK